MAKKHKVSTTDGSVISIQATDGAPGKVDKYKRIRTVKTTDGSVVAVQSLDRAPLRSIKTTDGGVAKVLPRDGGAPKR